MHVVTYFVFSLLSISFGQSCWQCALSVCQPCCLQVRERWHHHAHVCGLSLACSIKYVHSFVKQMSLDEPYLSTVWHTWPCGAFERCICQVTFCEFAAYEQLLPERKHSDSNPASLHTMTCTPQGCCLLQFGRHMVPCCMFVADLGCHHVAVLYSMNFCQKQ